MGRLSYCVLLMSVAAAQAFGATDADGEKKPPKTVVLITGPHDRATAAVVIEAVKSQLVDLDVDFAVQEEASLPALLRERIALAHGIAETKNSVAVFWYDFSSNSRIYLFLSGTEGERILVREIERAEGRGRAETLAIIVRSAVEAMLTGGGVGVDAAAVAHDEKGGLHATDPEAVRARKASPSEGRAGERRLWALRLSYMLLVTSMDHPAVQGLALGSDLRLHGGLSVIAGYAILDALEKDGEAASLRLRRHPAHLGLRLGFPISDRIAAAFTTALMIDYVTQEVFELAEGAAPSSDTDDIVFSVAPGLEAVLKLIDRVYLSFVLGASVPFNDRRYVADSPDGQELLIESRRVQPFVLVGLWTELL